MFEKLHCTIRAGELLSRVLAALTRLLSTSGVRGLNRNVREIRQTLWKDTIEKKFC